MACEARARPCWQRRHQDQANTAIALRGKGKRRCPSRRRTSGTVSGMGEAVTCCDPSSAETGGHARSCAHRTVTTASTSSTRVTWRNQPTKLRSGSRMMLPSPRPLRTARARFRACSLKPCERPLQDAVSQQVDLGCGFVGDSWGAGASGFLRRLIRLSISRGCDGSAIP